MAFLLPSEAFIPLRPVLVRLLADKAVDSHVFGGNPVCDTKRRRVREGSLRSADAGRKTGAMAAIQSRAGSPDYDRFLFRIHSGYDFDGIVEAGFV